MTVTAIKSEKTADGAEGEEQQSGGKKKLILVLLVVLLVLGGAGYWFVLRPSGPSKPEPGAVVPLESTQINLAGGHYLKVGIALQLEKGAPSELDGSKAMDATIDVFSGLPIGEVSKAGARHKLKEKLEKDLAKAYPDEVMGLYFTEFVTQ